VSDVHRRGHRRWIAVIVALALTQLYGLFCWRVLLARLGGASMGEALRAALSFRAPADWAWLVMAASALLGGAGYFLFIRRGAGGQGTVPGAVIWRRMRRVGVICALVMLAYVAAQFAYFLAGGEGVEGGEWKVLLPMGLFAAGALLFYRRKPSPEYLYALETGDGSRLQDERAQRVGGAAAALTLSVSLPILFFGGVLYEVLVRGEWPIRTYLELGVILLIWGLAGRHWNRVL